MAGDTVITVIGNLTADPELRYTQNGVGVANFTIASTPRSFNKETKEWEDGESLFLRCSAWRELAEHVGASLTKGTRVIAQGILKQRSYETKEGEKRTVIELEVEEIGPSLKYATASVTRSQGKSSGAGQAPVQNKAQDTWAPAAAATAPADTWSTAGAGGWDSETPF